MTKWQLGHQDAARRLLAETLPALDRELQSDSRPWIYQVGLEALRREAIELIKSNEAEEAVENKTRTSNAPQQ